MVAEKSDLLKTLDELQGKLRSALAERGFRTRGRAFNRTTSDGLTEVVHIQMGSFDPPGTTYIPGLREKSLRQVHHQLGCLRARSCRATGPEPAKLFRTRNSLLRTHEVRDAGVRAKRYLVGYPTG